MIASEIMTENPTTLAATDTVGQAIDALQSLSVRHLPIVDDRGQLIGMLSDRDLGPLMRTFTEGAEAHHMALPLSERRVSDLMSNDPISVELDADVTEVVQLMLDEHVGAIPVVDAGEHVRGIISYVDILRALGTSSAEVGESSQAW